MKLVATPAVHDALNRFLKLNPKKKWALEFGETWISHRFLIQIAHELPDTTLAELVKGISVYHDPPPPKPPKSPEYIALMERLRAEAQEREYQRLIRGPEADHQVMTLQETKEVKEQVTTIVNILVSVVAVTLAVWFWTSNWQAPVRTITSLMAALITAIAETVVYLGYKERVAEARAAELRKKEKKRVTKVLLGPGVDETTTKLVHREVKAEASAETALKMELNSEITTNALTTESLTTTTRRRK